MFYMNVYEVGTKEPVWTMEAKYVPKYFPGRTPLQAVNDWAQDIQETAHSWGNKEGWHIFAAFDMDDAPLAAVTAYIKSPEDIIDND